MPLEDPVVREVTLVLREWGGIWKKLYVVCTSFALNLLLEYYFYDHILKRFPKRVYSIGQAEKTLFLLPHLF